MDDEEKIKQTVEKLIQEKGWGDEEVQEALLEVARAHIWKKGLWARVKFVANVVGFIGVIGAAIMTISAVLGFEVVRRP